MVSGTIEMRLAKQVKGGEGASESESKLGDFGETSRFKMGPVARYEVRREEREMGRGSSAYFDATVSARAVNLVGLSLRPGPATWEKRLPDRQRRG